MCNVNLIWESFPGVITGIYCTCDVQQPTPDASGNSEQALSTAAIVMIVVGAYLALVTIALIIRQCLKVSSITEWFVAVITTRESLKQKYVTKFTVLADWLYDQ